MDQQQREHIELFISCRDLKDLDIFTVSDPFVVMFAYNVAAWFEFGRTEKIDNNLNPNFTKSMTIEYRFEIQQFLRFEVYHYVNQNHQKLIGKVETTLAAIVGSKDQKISLPIYDGSNQMGGIIVLRTDYVNHCPDLVKIHLSIQIYYHIKEAKDIISKRLVRGPNAFLRLSRLINDDPNPVLVYQTEPIKNQKDPDWQSIICKAQRLCNGDYQMPIKIELFDFKQNGKHVFIGEAAASLEQLRNGLSEINFKNINKFVGTLYITEFSQIITIYDFIQGGLQLNLIVAIDFTSSNKDICDITSLHYQDCLGTPSLYEQAIISVGNILINYDYDKKVPVYGFGCIPRLNGIRSFTPNHCFPLNNNPDDPEVFGLQGIIQIYRDTVGKLQFSGPTYIHPVIQEAMNQAKQIRDKQLDNYLILLILTDGQTNDIQRSIDDIIASSHLPLSIIIIGIGDENFQQMEVLNNNDLSMDDTNGKKSQRDLVQFVPFNKFKGDSSILSKEVLKELPDQVVQYMKLTNQPPKFAHGIYFNMKGAIKIQQQQNPAEQQQQVKQNYHI